MRTTAVLFILLISVSSEELAALRSSSESDDRSVVLPLSVVGTVSNGCDICGKFVVEMVPLPLYFEGGSLLVVEDNNDCFNVVEEAVGFVHVFRACIKGWLVLVLLDDLKALDKFASSDLAGLLLLCLLLLLCWKRKFFFPGF